MSWFQSTPFVLSANYHGGAFIINVPYDRYCKNQKISIHQYSTTSNLSCLDHGKSSISADDDIYQKFARSYVDRIRDTNRYCDPQEDDIGTVIRGADWYEIIGGMQDYVYLNYGTISMTMEISCCKYPKENHLLAYWNSNRDAMMELLLQAQRGLINEFNRSRSISISRCQRFDTQRRLSTHSFHTSDD